MEKQAQVKTYDASSGKFIDSNPFSIISTYSTNKSGKKLNPSSFLPITKVGNHSYKKEEKKL